MHGTGLTHIPTDCRTAKGLKANEVSKSKEKRQGKLNMHAIFEGVLMLFTKIIKISQCLSKLQLAKVFARFLRHWFRR